MHHDVIPISLNELVDKKIRDLAGASRSPYSSELLRKERSNIVASIRGANKVVSFSLYYNASLVLNVFSIF
jgi:hypothetical protein